MVCTAAAVDARCRSSAPKPVMRFSRVSITASTAKAASAAILKIAQRRLIIYRVSIRTPRWMGDANRKRTGLPSAVAFNGTALIQRPRIEPLIDHCLTAPDFQPAMRDVRQGSRELHRSFVIAAQRLHKTGKRLIRIQIVKLIGRHCTAPSQIDQAGAPGRSCRHPRPIFLTNNRTDHDGSVWQSRGIVEAEAMICAVSRQSLESA